MMAGSHRRKRTTWRTLVVTSSIAAITTGGMVAGYGLVTTQVALAGGAAGTGNTTVTENTGPCITASGADPTSTDPSICWFNFGSYVSPSAVPRSDVAASQNQPLVSSPQTGTDSTYVSSPDGTTSHQEKYQENLPNGDTVTFTLKYFPKSPSGDSNGTFYIDPEVKAVPAPVSTWLPAAFGRTAYAALKGSGSDPILYSQQYTALECIANNGNCPSSSSYGPAKWRFVLSNIQFSSHGNPITNFTMVAADGESTNSEETVEFKTNGGSWSPVGNMVPAIGSSTLSLDNTCGGNSGYASGDSLAQTFSNLLSSGGQVVSCDGNYGGHVGDLVVSSTFPSAASLTSSSGATIIGIDSLQGPSQEQGMAFGIELPVATPAPAPTPTTTPATVTPGLSLTKVEAPGSPDPITKAGQTITYDFNVKNTGNTTLNNLAIADTQSVSGEALTAPVSCPVTSLAAGASVTCSGTYTVTSTDITNGKVTDSATATATTTTGTSVTSNSSTLTIPVAVPTSAPSSVTPTTKTTTTKTVTPTTKSTSSPAPVKLITGPPTPPTTSTSDLPLGLAIAGIGLGGLGYVIIERKRHNGHNHEVA